MRTKINKVNSKKYSFFGNSNGNNSSRENIEEGRIKRELKEKTKCLDEKNNRLRLKESEFSKLNLQINNLHSEVDVMKKTVKENKRKRVLLAKKN
jgi:septal ring factor EnvC (AmiA/AmiB activator)